MKNIGVFLDHSVAKFINPATDQIEFEITNSLSGHERIPGQTTAGTKTGRISSSGNEYHEQKRRQQALYNYFREIALFLRNYEKVYLFGPTTAREEFIHFLQKQHSQRPPELDTEKTDYMSSRQLLAKVRQHFN